MHINQHFSQKTECTILNKIVHLDSIRFENSYRFVNKIKFI